VVQSFDEVEALLFLETFLLIDLALMQRAPFLSLLLLTGYVWCSTKIKQFPVNSLNPNSDPDVPLSFIMSVSSWFQSRKLCHVNLTERLSELKPPSIMPLLLVQDWSKAIWSQLIWQAKCILATLVKGVRDPDNPDGSVSLSIHQIQHIRMCASFWV
jgi:hypothetical protein